MVSYAENVSIWWRHHETMLVNMSYSTQDGCIQERTDLWTMCWHDNVKCQFSHAKSYSYKSKSQTCWRGECEILQFKIATLGWHGVLRNELVWMSDKTKGSWLNTETLYCQHLNPSTHPWNSILMLTSINLTEFKDRWSSSLVSKVSANERRRYPCNVFSHWLRPCTTVDKKRARV